MRRVKGVLRNTSENLARPETARGESTCTACFVELAKGHGKELVTDALDTLAIMHDDAAGEGVTRCFLEALQSMEVPGLYCNRSHDLDADNLARSLQDEIHLHLVLVAIVADQDIVGKQLGLLCKLREDEPFEQASEPCAILPNLSGINAPESGKQARGRESGVSVS